MGGSSGGYNDAHMTKFDKLRIDGGNYDAVKNLHLYLYNAAIKAIVGHMGKRLYKQLADHKDEQRLLAICLDRIEDKNDLVLSAKCITVARKRLLKALHSSFQTVSRLAIPKSASNPSPLRASSPFGKLGHARRKSIRKPKATAKILKEPRARDKKRPTASDRKKEEETKEAAEHSLIVSDLNLAAGLEALNSAVEAATSDANGGREIKGKSSWSSKEKAPRGKPQVPRAKSPRFHVRNLKSLERLKYSGQDRTPITRVADLVRGFLLDSHSRTSTTSTKFSNGPANASIFDLPATQAHHSNPNWQRTLEELRRVKSEVDERMRLPSARVAEHRMYDLVLDREEISLTPSERASPAALLSNAIELLSTWPSGGSQRLLPRGPSKRTLSPRLMPIVRRKPTSVDGDDNELLSPTLFALYDGDEVDEEEQGEPDYQGSNEVREGASRLAKTTSHNSYRGLGSITSMPSILEAVGIGNEDRKRIISTLIDVSGTTEFVDNALTVLRELNFLEPEVNGPILDARERMIGAFKNLELSMLPRQKRELQEHGMTFVQRRQLEKLLFEDQRVLNLTRDQLDFADIERFERMSWRQREEALWATIGHLAENGTAVTTPRKKRQAAKPISWLSVNQPTILSPYMFAPTFGLSVIGPVVLSPFMFSPPILNPSVISPAVLSPMFASPYILSPYVFGPFILSPFALMPFILSPYVLSPNILNPYVLSPMILSPIAISPNILSPGALSPAILSPSVLSPEIMSNSSMNPSILSPTFLS